MNSFNKKFNLNKLIYIGSKKHLNTYKILNIEGFDANIKMNENFVFTAYTGRVFIMLPRTILLYNNSIKLGTRTFDLTYAKFYDSRGEIIIDGNKFRFIPFVLYEQIRNSIPKVSKYNVIKNNKEFIMSQLSV